MSEVCLTAAVIRGRHAARRSFRTMLGATEPQSRRGHPGVRATGVESDLSGSWSALRLRRTARLPTEVNRARHASLRPIRTGVEPRSRRAAERLPASERLAWSPFSVVHGLRCVSVPSACPHRSDPRSPRVSPFDPNRCGATEPQSRGEPAGVRATGVESVLRGSWSALRLRPLRVSLLK